MVYAGIAEVEKISVTNFLADLGYRTSAIHKEKGQIFLDIVIFCGIDYNGRSFKMRCDIRGYHKDKGADI